MVKSIHTKIVASHMGLVVAACSVLGLASCSLITHTLMDRQTKELRLIARYAMDGLQGLVRSHEQRLEQIAQGMRVIRPGADAGDAALAEYLDRFTRDFPFLACVVGERPRESASARGSAPETCSDLRATAVYQLAKAHPNKAVSLFPQGTENPYAATVDYAFCLKGTQDEADRVVVGRIPLPDMAPHLIKFHFGDVGFVTLLDRHGTILAHPDQGRLLKTMVLSGPHAGQVATRVQALQSGSGRVTFEGTDSLVAWVSVPQRDWIVMAVRPRQEFLAGLQPLKEMTCLITAVVLILSWILASVLARAVTSPVSELAQAAHRVAKQDFSSRVLVRCDDEIGDLCRSFNQMAEDLQRTTTSIDALNQEIGERHRAQQRQAALIEQMKSVNQELRQFAYVVSHDLKTPLRGIRTLVDWLVEDCRDRLDDGNRQNLMLLSQRADRVNGLIDGILKYSRVCSTREEAVDLDLDKVVREVVDAASAHVNIQITVDASLPRVVCGKARIAQVFQNLIDNAIEYMDKPRGWIHVGWMDDGDTWRFSVADNGPGIEERYFEKIFKLFQTLAPKDRHEGSGIGLSIAQKIVEQYGGRIWVESELEKGSTFFFTIPKVAKAQTEG